MIDEDRVRKLARRFRDAVLKCDKSEIPLSWAEFPTGSCADASILLGSYLNDNGVTGFTLIKGRRGEGNSLETHYWLENDGMIVDITADQFEGINEEVIITDSASDWHRTFSKEIRHEADYRAIAASDVKAHLEVIYNYILQFENGNG